MTNLITFKGYRNGITLILNDSEPDFKKILNELRTKLIHLNFFKDAVINIDIGRRKDLSPEQLTSLKEILSTKNIQVKNVVLNTEKPANHRILPTQVNQQTTNSNTLMINKTIRSGQHLCYQGNIVLIGDIHPGGEVIAQGNVIVWGTIRGLVHAGSNGNKEAFIIALQLVPTQLRIAQYVACAPEYEQHLALSCRPEIAYLRDKIIVIEDYNSTKNALANFTVLRRESPLF